MDALGSFTYEVLTKIKVLDPLSALSTRQGRERLTPSPFFGCLIALNMKYASLSWNS